MLIPAPTTTNQVHLVTLTTNSTGLAVHSQPIQQLRPVHRSTRVPSHHSNQSRRLQSPPVLQQHPLDNRTRSTTTYRPSYQRIPVQELEASPTLVNESTSQTSLTSRLSTHPLLNPPVQLHQLPDLSQATQIPTPVATPTQHTHFQPDQRLNHLLQQLPDSVALRQYQLRLRHLAQERDRALQLLQEGLELQASVTQRPTADRRQTRRPRHSENLHDPVGVVPLEYLDPEVAVSRRKKTLRNLQKALKDLFSICRALKNRRPQRATN